MESLEFLAIIATFAVVAVWYLQNAETGSDAARGLLAIKQDPAKTRRKSYRIKPRLARRAHEMRDAESLRAVSEAKPAFRKADHTARMRQKFRRQDESRYRVKDKAAAYKTGDGYTAA